MGRGLRFVLPAALALVAAAALALLATAVLAVRGHLRASDAFLTHATATFEAESSHGFRFRLAEKMLGAADDRALRDAVRAFKVHNLEGTSERTARSARGQAEVALTRVAQEAGDPELRSHAATFLGVLLFEDAKLQDESAPRYLDLSLEAFRSAAILDPRNEEAKFDLELLLTNLSRAQKPGLSGGPGRQGTQGAVQSAGSGY